MLNSTFMAFISLLSTFYAQHRTSTGDDDQRGHESGLLSDYHKNSTANGYC